MALRLRAALRAEPGRRARLRISRRSAAVVLLVALGFLVGFLVAPRGPGGTPLATYHDDDLWALVPAGWEDEGLVAPYGTARVGWVDGSDPHESETVQATLPASASPQARASARAAQLHGLSGYAQAYLGPLNLPGGRATWLLQYSLSGTYTAVFEFDACTPAIAMTITVDAPTPTLLSRLDDDLAEGAEPVCDGPAFSAGDGADVALPLTLPS
ncbi:MAG TPA: hypothetical protein VL977_06345 [Solirubrobacteraceae bacterium]|nr:hypothetical protein [Solirubrobacteraceae bacterium]